MRGGGGGLETLNWLSCQGWLGRAEDDHGAGSRPRTPGRRGEVVEGGFEDRLIAECLTDEELQGFRAKLRKYAEVVHQRRGAA